MIRYVKAISYTTVIDEPVIGGKRWDQLGNSSSISRFHRVNSFSFHDIIQWRYHGIWSFAYETRKKYIIEWQGLRKYLRWKPVDISCKKGKLVIEGEKYITKNQLISFKYDVWITVTGPFDAVRLNIILYGQHRSMKKIFTISKCFYYYLLVMSV